MPRRGSSKPPAEPVVKPYGCDFRMLRDGVLPIEKIAEYSGPDTAEVKLLAGLQKV